jgi:hypothetical protein
MLDVDIIFGMYLMQTAIKNRTRDIYINSPRHSFSSWSLILNNEKVVINARIFASGVIEKVFDTANVATIKIIIIPQNATNGKTQFSFFLFMVVAITKTKRRISKAL